MRRVTEEVCDALREVTRETEAYFDTEALRPFLLFSPDFHRKLDARFKHLDAREKQSAIGDELEQLMGTLSVRYGERGNGDIQGETVTFLKRMSHSGMLAQVKLLHRTMWRANGKSAYAMAAAIASG